MWCGNLFESGLIKKFGGGTAKYFGSEVPYFCRGGIAKYYGK